MGETGSWVFVSVKELWDGWELEKISMDWIDGRPKIPLELGVLSTKNGRNMYSGVPVSFKNFRGNSTPSGRISKRLLLWEEKE